MTLENYKERRVQLVSDFYFQMSHHCRMNARARIRDIARLEYEFRGTPEKETKQLFKYDEI